MPQTPSSLIRCEKALWEISAQSHKDYPSKGGKGAHNV